MSIFKKGTIDVPKPEPIPEPAPVVVPPKEGRTRLEIALAITGSFEGKGYGQVTGNFDGMGISCGILQWNLGMESLQGRILKPYRNRHGSIDALGLFPRSIDPLCFMGAGNAVAFAKEHILTGTAVKPEWKKAWAAFMQRPEVIKLQLEACQGVEASADRIMKSFGLDSIRAFTWFFDLVVLNGGMKGVIVAKPDRAHARDVCARLMAQGYGAEDTVKNRSVWLPMIDSATDEQVSLLITSHQRALLSRHEFYSDVVNRKGSIAMGKGWVHASLRYFPELNS